MNGKCGGYCDPRPARVDEYMQQSRPYQTSERMLKEQHPELTYCITTVSFRVFGLHTRLDRTSGVSRCKSSRVRPSKIVANA